MFVLKSKYNRLKRKCLDQTRELIETRIERDELRDRITTESEENRMAPKYAARIDANQPAIVRTLRQMGCSVALTHTVGGGFTDLVVGVAGVNLLVEVKDGDKPPSARVLTPDQVAFHREWRGRTDVVKDRDEVIDIINAIRRGE